MNEKFKQLAEQARIQMCSDERLQEYGELIVKECSKAIFERNERVEPAPHIYILKHFGVEL